MIAFSFAESHTFAAGFPNTEKNGAVVEDAEDRDYSWLGLLGLIGLVGLRRKDGGRKK
jgi:MYXO-CTERM domain-containing protein